MKSDVFWLIFLKISRNDQTGQEGLSSQMDFKIHSNIPWKPIKSKSESETKTKKDD